MRSSVFKRFLAVAVLFLSSNAVAEVPARYFRVWEGFRRADLSEQKFLQELPSFMAETVKLYGSRGVLSNYIVVVPPQEKPSYIPDELALVALTGEAQYREIRETPQGQAYGARHWDIFERTISKSASQFIDYQRTRPQTLVDGAAYDLVGTPIDWSTGYTLVFIGTKKAQIAPSDFLKHLKIHIELAHRHMVPQGLRGYIVTAHENYEVAYLNWTSKAAHDRALDSLGGKAVFADAGKIMDPLMYQEATDAGPEIRIETGKVYSTRSKGQAYTQALKGALKMKALIVVTSHEQLGNTGKKTGYYLPEVTHPFFELKQAGLQVDICRRPRHHVGLS